MPRKCRRRQAKGGAAVCDTRCAARARQAHSAARDRACLSCDSPGIPKMCGSCGTERALERLGDPIAGQAQPLASEAGPSAPRLPVRPYLRPKPRLGLLRPELELAPEWTRQAARDLDGWCWQPTAALPAMHVEAFPTSGQA
jgi:hypothetical protein